MRKHNPYDLMLEAIRDTNDLDNENLTRESLRKTQPYVKSLRETYRNFSAVDYSHRYNKGAYLLAYYPAYTEILYNVLRNLPQDIIVPSFEQTKLRGCFFGAGPAPEIIGWLSYLEENVSIVETATAYLLDKYVNIWRVGQEITRYQVAPKFWPDRKIITVPHEFDFLNIDTYWNESVERCVSLCNFFVMQNCLNELIKASSDFLENLLWIFRQIPIGSIFIIIDPNFQKVRDFISKFQKTVIQQGLGKVVQSVTDKCQVFRSQFEIPAIIQEELLTGEDLLKPRQNINYYFSALMRIEDKPF
jgi:hypothetical protein